MISFLFAMGSNRVIGKDNDLPWHLPADLAYFKKKTMGHPIIMGRKTYESIGKPLPGRENIVVTRDKHFTAEGCTIVHSIEEASNVVKGNEESFVIGGANLFEAFYPYADRMYVTLIHESFEGDTYFREIDEREWKLVATEQHEKDEKNKYDYTFLVYDRI
ncbi:MAG TPA: type 3 dihydrofolate reductase [Bacillales bacterium]|nr:type 3 dihydrofolate reductase [Bacillales bacterium]